MAFQTTYAQSKTIHISPDHVNNAYAPDTQLPDSLVSTTAAAAVSSSHMLKAHDSLTLDSTHGELSRERERDFYVNGKTCLPYHGHKTAIRSYYQ